MKPKKGKVMKQQHNHYWKASDIPGVCLCKCGAEVYYASEKQAYVMRSTTETGLRYAFNYRNKEAQ